MASEVTIDGVVKWFDDRKGYGFITPSDDGPEVIIHIKALQAYGVRTVADGARISCVIAQRDQGWYVDRVTWLDDTVARIIKHRKRADMTWTERDHAAYMLGRGEKLDDIERETGVPKIDLLDMAAAAAHAEAARTLAAQTRVQRPASPRANGTTSR